MVDNQQLTMEVDTGAAVSLVSEETHQWMWPDKPLQPATTVLRTYSGEHLSVCGCRKVDVVYSQQHWVLPLLVIKGKGPRLLGRDWLKQIRLNWG